MSGLRLLSNNLWWNDKNNEAWEALGEDCSAKARARGFARVYDELKPDVIGLQECSGPMTHSLMTELLESGAKYSILWGRDTPVIYRADRFELVESEVYIYPEEVPGLEGSFNNLKTKSYAIAVLKEKQTGKMFAFATTHLWYMSDDPSAKYYQKGSEQARKYQMNLLIDRLDALQNRYLCSAVIVGDFNTWYTGAAVTAAKERNFVHAHDVAKEYAADTTGMHRCDSSGFSREVNPGGFKYSIDHFLIRGELADNVRRFDRFCTDWYYPLSDHLPICVDIDF